MLRSPRRRRPRPSREPGGGIAVAHWGAQGGGPLFHLQLTRALAERRPGVVACLSSRSDQRVVVDELGVRTHVAMIPKGVLTSPRSWGPLVHSVIGLRKVLREAGVETVVISMDTPHLILLVPVLRSASCRIILGLHDPRFHLGDGSPGQALGRFVGILGSDAILTFSRTSHDAVQRMIGSDSLPCFESVHAAFGEPSEHPRSLPSDGEVTLGFFGRITPYKGVDVLLAAFRILRQRSTRYRLVIHGEGDLPGGVDLTSLAGLTVDNRWIENEEIPRVLEGIDVAVLPYLEATQSGVLAFTMAAGVPSVVTPVGSLGEQVRESGAGLVAAAITPEAVAAAIEDATGDPSCYRAMSAAGLRAATEEYSWARVATDVEDALQIVGASPRPPFPRRWRAAVRLLTGC